MKTGVTTYYFDVLRLMLVGEIFFVQSFDSYSNVLAVMTLVSKYFCYKM